MKLKKINKSEFDSLMNLMDVAFNFSDGNRFVDILPKFYYQDNKNMTHYGIYEDDKLVSSIGLYDMEFIHNDKTLKVGCIGGVSTHPDYRNKGYFTIIMNKLMKYAKSHKYDLLFLGGNRIRYNHFGFEVGGRKLVFNLTNRSTTNLKYKEYEVLPLLKNDISSISKCLDLYNKSTIHIKRTINDFYNHVISWKCVPYIVKVNNKIIGYYSLKDDEYVYEFVYQKGYRNTMLKACLNNKNSINIQTSMDEFDNELLKYVEWYKVEHNEMFNILNYEKVLSFLDIDLNALDELNKLDKFEKIRAILSDSVYQSKYTTLPMYIYSCDQG